MRAIWLKPEHEPFRKEIEETLVEELYVRNTGSLISLALVLLVMWVTTEQAIAHPHLLRVLFAVEYVLIAARAWLVVTVAKRKGPFRDVAVRHRAFALGASGIACGLGAIAAIAVPDLDAGHLLIMVLGYMGVLSTAVISMGSSPAVFTFYSAAILTPFFVLAAMGRVQTDSILLGAMMMLYPIVLGTVVRHDYEARCENTFLRLKVADMALVDPLTNTRNRRFLHELMPLESEAILRTRYNLDRASMAAIPKDARPPSSMWLLIVDLDHFKQVNDTHGHEAGDTVLQQAAQVLRDAVRKQDIVARWGGEEFVVVAPDTDEYAEGNSLAERVRSEVAAHAFLLPSGDILRLTCSVGYARYPFFVGSPGELRWDEVLAIADVGLYQAKHSGRDRTVGILAGTPDVVNIAEAVDVIKHDLSAAEGHGYVKVVAQSRPVAQ